LVSRNVQIVVNLEFLICFTYKYEKIGVNEKQIFKWHPTHPYVYVKWHHVPNVKCYQMFDR